MATLSSKKTYADETIMILQSQTEMKDHDSFMTI